MPAGRPPRYRKDFHPAEYVRLSAKGRHISEISFAWGTHRDTLYDWAKKHPEFSDAMKKGMEAREDWWVRLGESGMTGTLKDETTKEKRTLNPTLYIWLSRNILKWSEDRGATQPKEAEDQGDVVYDVEMGDGEKKDA